MYSFKKAINTSFTSNNQKLFSSERFPRILTPKLLALVFLYSLAFTLLLFGWKMLRLEHQAATSASRLVSTFSQFPSDNSQLTVLNRQSPEASFLYQQKSDEEIQQSIASQIIRLHVIANSDTNSDQSLKLKVRDSIIQDMQSALKDASSIEDARSILTEKMPQIQKKAQKTIQKEGYDYPVSISLNQRYFPVKVYGDLTFPAGEYEALCLEIGKASGRNWWCVLFPSLCFVDETYAVVPEESKEKLQDSLSEQEYASLENESEGEDSSTDVQLRSGILDWLSEQ